MDAKSPETPGDNGVLSPLVMGLRALDEQRHEDALGCFRASLNIRHTPQALYYIAICLERLGRTEEATQAYRDARGLARMVDASRIEGDGLRIIIHEISEALDRLAVAK